MRYLDKFGRIWSIYDVLSSYTASLSFKICLGVIIWISMMNSTRKIHIKSFSWRFSWKVSKYEILWQIWNNMINLWHLEHLFSFDQLLNVSLSNHMDLNDKFNDKKSYEAFLMKIFLKSIEIWNTWTNLVEYD